MTNVAEQAAGAVEEASPVGEGEWLTSCAISTNAVLPQRRSPLLPSRTRPLHRRDGLRAHGILAADADPQRLVQRALEPLLCVGARAFAFDTRSDIFALSP